MIFYSTENTDRNEISQPQLQRARSRFRGPRESYKFNLEVSQTTFDIVRLYQEVNDTKAIYDANTIVMHDGGTVAGQVLEGLEELTNRLHRLRDRVRILEARADG